MVFFILNNSECSNFADKKEEFLKFIKSYFGK